MFATNRLRQPIAVLTLVACCVLPGCTTGGATFGCLPGVRVIKNPTDCDEGIRYYRPKPYLLLTSAAQQEVKEATTTTPKTTIIRPDVRYVSITLDYLPDFSEEYAINVTPGFGVANVDVKLEDGWNLTGINQSLDSKVADNIKAIAELTKALPLEGARLTNGDDLAQQILACTNVPLGYYEAVLGRDHCGKKRLFGWRYVGFMPYATCPTDGVGSALHNCQADMLYGLVFDGDVMVFKPLHEVAARTEVKTYETNNNDKWTGECPCPAPDATYLPARSPEIPGGPIPFVPVPAGP